MKDDISSVEATVSIRIVASALVFISALIGLTLQMLLGIALYKGWHLFRRKSFYLITVQLMWCDICALLIDLYAAFPMTLTGSQYMGDSLLLYYIPLAFEGVAFNGIFMLSFFLTVNRFLLFIFPAINMKLFSARGTKIVSICLWIYVFTLIGMSNVLGCRKGFSKEDFYFWYNCEFSERGAVYKKFIYIHSYAVASIMTIMYVIIYAKLKLSIIFWKANKTKSLKQEIKYLIQTLLICVIIALEIVSFIVLPFLGITGYGKFYVNTLLNLILITNNMMAPIVILSFNYEVRGHLKSLFRWKKTSILSFIH